MTQALKSSAARDSARLVCNKLQQATRSLRLYPADHPTAHRVLVEFTEELGAHMDKYGPLMLRVDEKVLLYEDQEVYFQEEMRGSLAFIMFRDGIRFLTFHPGIDRAETGSFVDCLAHADDLAEMEHDLATVLWERDLQHIGYEVADPFLSGSGGTLRGEVANELRDTVLRRLSELTPGGGGAAAAAAGPAGAAGQDVGGGGAAAAGGDEGGHAAGDGSPRSGGSAGSEAAEPDSVDPNAVAVTETDIQRGEAAVAGLDDILADFALVLLEIAGFEGPPGWEDTLPSTLGMVVERYLETTDIQGLAAIVDRLAALEQQGRRPREFGAAVFGEVTTNERLARLIDSMDELPPDEAQIVDAMLPKMRNWILPGLLEMLAESGDRGVRKIALDLLELEGGVPVEYLWPLMDDPRWYVVRNAVALATRSGDPQLVDRLEPLTRHPDVRVRREVLRSLDMLTGSRLVISFVRALGDEDSGVRVLAANGLSRHGSRANVPSLEAQIEAREFATRPAEEIGAILLAYATLGGDATVEVLNRLWRRRVFGTRPMPLRLAAVQALGAVHSPSARDALTEASKSNEAQIQRTAARTLAEARARMTGQRP